VAGEDLMREDSTSVPIEGAEALENKAPTGVALTPTQKFFIAPETPSTQLFSNPVDNETSFGISREFTDSYARLVQDINPEQANLSYSKLAGQNTYQTKDNQVSVRLIDPKNVIRSEKDFYNELEKIKSGKSLQTLLALWDYANQQGGFHFNGVKIDQIMKTLLKVPATGYYTQQQKRDFSAAIHHLRDIELTLDSSTTYTEKGKKKQATKRDYYRLVDLTGAVYAKTKDPETGEWVTDDSVIVKMFGELLPRYNKGIMRGRLLSRGILELDANKDEKAILLGFKLLNRLDQMRMGKKGSQNAVAEGKLYLRLPRKVLIEWAEYEKTDEVNKSVASQHLMKTLHKLIDVQCLRDFQPREITTDDSQFICIYPYPIAKSIDRPNESTSILLKKRVKNSGKSETASWLGITVETLDEALLSKYELTDEQKARLTSDY